ncbi:MAG: histidine phosphatase family protein, partial [Planctomycetales bacterium]|nr:histidine phosphatase family protein [Planctomycetales bacterium]
MGKKDDAVMYLVRHGATAANDSGRLQGRGIDLPLSPGGCEQIAVTADAL